MSRAPALPPLTDAAWPDEIGDLLHGFAGRLNVYRVMAHHPRLLRAWQTFRHHVVVETSLGRELSEVVILRTGFRLDVSYEWAHHVVRARACGMDDARIATLAGPVTGMAPVDAILCRAVDELVDNVRLSPESHLAVARLVGVEGLLDVMATVSHYAMLAYVLNSFDPPVDENVRAALERRPAPLPARSWR